MIKLDNPEQYICDKCAVQLDAETGTFLELRHYWHDTILCIKCAKIKVNESFENLVTNAMEKGSDLQDAEDNARICLVDMYGNESLELLE